MSVESKLSQAEDGIDDAFAALTPGERLRLSIGALTSDDDALYARLQRSCPRKKYTAQEAEFSDRWDFAAELVSLFATSLSRQATALDLLAVAAENFGIIAKAYARISGTAWLDGMHAMQGIPKAELFGGPAVDIDDENGPEVEHPADFRERFLAVCAKADETEKVYADWLIEEIADAAGQLHACWRAFTEFCERLGVDPLPIAAKTMPAVAEALAKHPAAPTDEQIELHRAGVRLWDQRFSGGMTRWT